jgi:hypothetical protein
VKGICDGTVTKRPTWGGKPYKLPCGKPADFALAPWRDSDHVLEACRVHLPHMVQRMIKNFETDHVDVVVTH